MLLFLKAGLEQRTDELVIWYICDYQRKFLPFLGPLGTAILVELRI